jgi:hypothetical protein
LQGLTKASFEYLLWDYERNKNFDTKFKEFCINRRKSINLTDDELNLLRLEAYKIYVIEHSYSKILEVMPEDLRSLYINWQNK